MPPKTQLNTISTFNKVVKQTQYTKIRDFVCYSNEQTQEQIRKTITFAITSKIYIGINLTKEAKDIYNEN
jgi:hypothetical protein